MSSNIQIVGDNILFDGQIVAVIFQGLIPSLRFEFCDVISDIKTEQEMTDEIDKKREEAYREGQQFILEELGSALEPLEDVSRVQIIIAEISSGLAA